MAEIEIGMRGERVITVSEELTARYMGSGSLDVYATPAMVALMEAAAVEAINRTLPEEQTSVGIEMNVEHLAATPVGEEVRAQAEVIDTQGKRITFSVRAWDDEDLIGEGTHVRYLINIEQFMARVKGKGAQ